MLIWAIFAVMAAAAVALVLRPLASKRGSADRRSVRESAIYRDQIAEIDREVERGLVSAAEAKGMRAEVGRRLIAADQAARGSVPSSVGASWRKPAAVAVVAAVPAIAVGLYVGVGSPALRDAPFASRPDPAVEEQQIRAIVARIEQHLAANPTDARGWEVIAPEYMRERRFTDAVAAWRRAIQHGGETARRLAGLGEAQVYAAEGTVTGEARANFERAAALDPEALKPQYYLGFAAVHDREYARAIAIWEAMIAEAPADAPLVQVATQLIEVARRGLAEEAAKTAPASAPQPDAAAPGPTSEDIAAAAALSEEERRAMIEGMVEGLAAKLEADGSDLDGWIRLVRSYVVLDRRDDARDAIARARETFAGESAALQRLDAAADSLGLDS